MWTSTRRAGATESIEPEEAEESWRRRRWLAIFGGVIAALALIAALTAWMSQVPVNGSTPISADATTAKTLPAPEDGGQLRIPNYGPAPDYVLALESVGADADEPRDPHDTLNLLGLSDAELRQFEDFRGLRVWSGESRSGTACLLVAHPVQGLLEGIGDARCAPNGLDTIADIPLCSGCAAPGVFTGLPTGSLIRFVLKGDHVDVYVYVRAAADPTASQGR